MLLGFAFVTVSVLAAVVPTGEEYAKIANVETPTAYSIAYLEVLTRANPEDVHLRMLYVRQLQALGRYSEALTVLEPALEDAHYFIEAHNLALHLHLAEARRLPEGSLARQEAFVRIEKELPVLMELDQPPEVLWELSGLALELDRPALAAAILVRLADTNPKQRTAALAEAARWFRASGRGDLAANYAVRAAATELDPVKAKKFASFAIESREAMDDVFGAADLAKQYAERYPDDLSLNEHATRLSTACSRHKDAQRFGRHLLEMQPESDGLLFDQMNRELAAGDLKSALVLAKRLVERNPHNIALRQNEARIAEWAGEPELALKDWLWLLGRGRTRDDKPEIIELK